MDKKITLKDILSEAWMVAKANLGVLIAFTAISITVSVGLYFLLPKLLSSIAFEGAWVTVLKHVISGIVQAFFAVSFYQAFFHVLNHKATLRLIYFIPNGAKVLKYTMVILVFEACLTLIIMGFIALYFLFFPSYSAHSAALESSNWGEWKNICDTLFPSLGRNLPYVAYRNYSFVLIGIVIFIIYLSIRMSFALCFVVDQHFGAIKAMKQSWVLTRGYVWFLLGLFLAIVGINLLGAISLLIGLLITIPLSSLIFIVAYRQMIDMTSISKADPVTLASPSV